jgi:hypothetical protein
MNKKIWLATYSTVYAIVYHQNNLFNLKGYQINITIVYFKYSGYHRRPVCVTPVVGVPQVGNP